jgi:hypothetical protein
MSTLRGRPGNLDEGYDVSIWYFQLYTECLTLGGRKSLGIVSEPMGIWLREDCYIVSCILFSTIEDALHWKTLGAPKFDERSDHWYNAIQATYCKLTLLLPVSWHIVLSRKGDSTTPMTQWPQQSQPSQPYSIERERRRGGSLRRSRYAVIPNCQHSPQCQYSSHIHRSFIESMLFVL